MGNNGYEYGLDRVMRDLMGMGREFNDMVLAPGAYKMNSYKTMRTDIVETDDAIKFTVELPGCNKEDIKIKLEDNNLIISVNKNEESTKTDENGRVVLRERHTGSSSRSFVMPEGMNSSDISAKFENGELFITCKKPVEEKKDTTINID